jgi:hypothetical protein
LETIFAIGLNQDVFGLEISMDNSTLVDVANTLNQLAHYFDHVGL